jgi:hypothetical protein
VGHVAHRGDKRNVYTLLVRKPEGKRPLGSPGYGCKDNIRLGLTEIGGKVCTECIWLRIGYSGGLL